MVYVLSGGEKSYPHLAIYAAVFCSYNEAISVVRLAGRQIPPLAVGGQRELSAPLNAEQGSLFI